MNRTLNPSEKFRVIVFALNTANTLVWLLARQVYVCPELADIYPLYQGEFCRKVIAVILRVQDIQFGLQCCSVVGLVLTLLMTLCETAVVESCLPEFKGTYDEDQDELLAVDWTPISKEEAQL